MAVALGAPLRMRVLLKAAGGMWAFHRALPLVGKSRRTTRGGITCSVNVCVIQVGSTYLLTILFPEFLTYASGTKLRWGRVRNPQGGFGSTVQRLTTY